MNPSELINKFQQSSIKQIKNDIEEDRTITQSQYGTESESSKDYVGRVVFEFFQNAVDRAEKNIWLELSKDKFIISNDGTPFTIYESKENTKKKSDFHGLNSIHDGTKTAGESIGNKGVGFKSCWNVSEKVLIESIKDNLAWGFELFKPLKAEYFEDDENIQKAIKSVDGKVPSFYFPKCYESKLENFKQNTVTKITIKLKDDEAYSEIKKELEDFKKAKFFFLNQLKNSEDKDIQINISIDNEDIESFGTKNDNWKIITLSNNYNDLKKELNVARKKESYSNIPDEPNIAIAFPQDDIVFPQDDKEFESYFYTYLPTKAKCGFNILVHADFALDNARVSIPDNNYNNKVLEIASKIFINELLNNEELHKNENFGKFLIPNNKDDKFAQLVWAEFTKVGDNEVHVLTQILKKVYTKDRHLKKESYSFVFASISKWKREHRSGETWKYYHGEIYNLILKYFCNEDSYIVYIDEETKTFLPERLQETGHYKQSLFYKDEKEENDKEKILDFRLLKDIDKIKITSFNEIRSDLFYHNNIARRFSTLEIIRTLKNLINGDTTKDDKIKINIILFISQLLEESKEVLSVEIKEQLQNIKLPIKNDFKEIRYCYINIDENISSLFNKKFARVDKEQLKDIKDLDSFLGKIGVANNTLPYDVVEKNIILPFDDDTKFSYSNDMKNFINNSLETLCNETINKLKEIKWFYDEKKEDNLFSPNEVFLFKDGDNRTINCIAQEKRNKIYETLYSKFEIYEIDDTEDTSKIINQLKKMKDLSIDNNHQDIYKKLTSQLAKLYKNNDEVLKEIPILAINIQNQNIEYVENKKIDKIVFLETKYKQYKEQIKGDYDYIGYFNTDISHKFLENLKINIFNPNYNISYYDGSEKDIEPIIDLKLKKDLQNEFLAIFFALANEMLGSKFEKEDALKRWENLTIKKAYNVIMRLEDNHKEIIVGSTKKPNNDVLFMPIKDKVNNISLIGEVAHDLEEPMENGKLWKFAQVFSEGIFKSQKLKNDFELFISGEKARKDDILSNKGIEKNHIEEMQNFINENLLSEDEKNKILEILKVHIKIDNFSQIRDFEKYENLDLGFGEFKELFEEKYQFIIDNIINDYKAFIKNKISQEISKNEKYLKVLCFYNHKTRETFKHKENEIINKKITRFNNELNIYKLFDVEKLDKNSDEYISSLIDFEWHTDEISENKIELKSKSNSLEAQPRPFTGNASKKQNEKERSEKNMQKGLGQELKLAYKFATRIKNKEQFIKMIKAKIYENDDDLRDDENLKRYIENLDNYEKYNDLEFSKNVIQIANNNLDGIGYDLIIPIFKDNEENEIIGIKKVELKSTSRDDNIEVHFSHNEIQRAIHYINKDAKNWEVWLNSEDKNITETVKEAIKKMPKENLPFYFNDYILKFE